MSFEAGIAAARRATRAFRRATARAITRPTILLSGIFGTHAAAVYLNHVARQEIAAGRLTSAVNLARCAIAADGEWEDAYAVLTYALLQDGDLSSARDAAMKGVEIAPESGLLLGYLGTIEQKAGRLAEAEAAFRRSLLVRPGNPDTLMRLGEVLWIQARMSDALAEFRDAHSFAPLDYRPLLAMGQAQVQLGNYHAAVEALHEAVKQNPQDAGSYMYLAISLAGLRQWTDAAAAARRAAELDPKSPEIRDALRSIESRIKGGVPQEDSNPAAPVNDSARGF